MFPVVKTTSLAGMPRDVWEHCLYPHIAPDALHNWRLVCRMARDVTYACTSTLEWDTDDPIRVELLLTARKLMGIVAKFPRLQKLVIKHRMVYTDLLADALETSAAQLRQLELHFCVVIGDFSKLASVEHLVLSKCGMDSGVLPGLAGDRLRVLDVNTSLNVRDLGTIAVCTTLVQLDLSCTNVSDVQPLASCTTLRTLNLARTSVNDIQPVASLVELTCLDLSGTLVSNIQPVASLVELTWLDLSNISVSSIGPVALCTALITLKLRGCVLLTDLEPLACTDLQELDLTGCTRLHSIHALRLCSQLQRLCMRDCRSVRTIRALESCTELRTLDLTGCVGLKDIDALDACTRLTSLLLLGTGLQAPARLHARVAH